jgi:hypothetical protein
MKRLHVHGPLLEEGSIEDPQGLRWETFLTTGESTVYGGDAVAASAAACCA